MKTKNIIALLAAALILGACSDNYLNRTPDSSTLTEEQFRSLDDALEGTVRGLWSQFYEYGGDHDDFGVRSIDLFTDIFAGDVAMASNSYGWFRTDEYGQTYVYRGSTLWSFYYSIIRQCNKGINAVEAFGGLEFDNIKTETQYTNAYYYGQLLAVRGWCYANLVKYFTKTTDQIDPDNDLAIPIYDESYTRTDELLGAPRSTVAAVYERATQDLMTAIRYLELTNGKVYRESKLEFDADVARVILAYAYINWGGAENYDYAYDYAKQVIDNGKYNILPHSQLFSTGFADINSTNWLWGQEVTIDNTTALASFFGQVDIHTYSYAWAGDTKSIDNALYSEITTKGWDDRANWFRNVGSYKLVPDRKFFSPGHENTTNQNRIDRDWLSDNVWLRMETAYLIAAEAALNRTNPSLDTAQLYLDAIMSERIIPGKEAEYATYKASLSSASALTQALIYNWRVEMWGEGYSLQTFRRLEHTRTLGSNHMTRQNQALNYADGRYEFEIPSSETRYNPYLADDELTANKREY